MGNASNCILEREWVKSMPNDPGRTLVAQMQQYTAEVTAEIDRTVADVGQQALAMLKADAPRKKGKGGGKYRRSLTMELSKGNGKAGFIAYAKAPQYRLTHLLESGHRTRLKSGIYGKKSFVTGKPHFAPVQAWADEELLRRIEEVLQK